MLAYVKNQDLGFEASCHYKAAPRTYLPDFILRVDDGHSPDNPLHLVEEVKDYRRENSTEKKNTVDVYWVPGVNWLEQYGRRAFAEFTEVYAMSGDFLAEVSKQFNQMIEECRDVQ